MASARQRNVALLVACCFFMQNLDGTIVVTSAQKIGDSLRVSSLQVSLVITAYLITCAVLIPLGSWLVGGLGARRVFLGAIVLFTAASLLCGISRNLPMLVGMRILQGCGGALMTPTGRILALTNIEKYDFLRILSFIVWPALVAPVIAPLLGGLITTYANWHWIFFINLPFGVVALAIGARMIPADAPDGWATLDSLGFALTGIGLGGLTYAAHLLSVDTPAWETVAFAVVSLAALAAAKRHLGRAARPLLDLTVYRIRTFRSSTTGITVFSLVVGAVPFVLPLLFQDVFGWSAVKSGAFVIWIFAGNVGMKPATSWLLRRFGFRAVLAWTTLAVGASVVVMGFFRATTPEVLIAVLLFVSGCARSMGYTAYMSLAFADVEEADMRNSNVLYSTVQQVGAALAVASGAAAIHLGGTIASIFVTHPEPLDGYASALFVLSLLGGVACWMALRLPSSAGDSLRAPAGAPPRIEIEADSIEIV